MKQNSPVHLYHKESKITYTQGSTNKTNRILNPSSHNSPTPPFRPRGIPPLSCHHTTIAVCIACNVMPACPAVIFKQVPGPLPWRSTRPVSIGCSSLVGRRVFRLSSLRGWEIAGWGLLEPHWTRWCCCPALGSDESFEGCWSPMVLVLRLRCLMGWRLLWRFLVVGIIRRAGAFALEVGACRYFPRDEPQMCLRMMAALGKQYRGRQWEFG